jgi:Sugar (and other) transporter
MKALKKCRGEDYDIAPEFQRLESSVKAQDAMSGHLKDLIVFGNMKPFLVVLCLMILQQMSGTSVIIFYMTRIFNDAGSDMSPLTRSVACNSIKVVRTID